MCLQIYSFSYRLELWIKLSRFSLEQVFQSSIDSIQSIRVWAEDGPRHPTYQVIIIIQCSGCSEILICMFSCAMLPSAALFHTSTFTNMEAQVEEFQTSHSKPNIACSQSVQHPSLHNALISCACEKKEKKMALCYSPGRAWAFEEAARTSAASGLENLIM